MTRRRFSLALPLAAALLAGFAGPAPADDPPATKAAKVPAWETARTTAPGSIADLRALEVATKRVVDKTTAATVGLFIGMGAGSGVIVNEDGLILTAAHVSGAPGTKCKVILPDGTEVTGKSLGTNTKIDSGMIQITDKAKTPDGKWPTVALGKSGDLKKGQWVVTLGHHGGWRPGRPPVARLGQVLDSQKDLIRTNCTLVGGDSGGPLFDLDGKLVGIHSRIGFTLAQNIHVPVDGFKTDWDQLLAGVEVGKTKAPPPVYFGASFEDAEGNEVKGTKGAKVTLVAEDGPAAEAGMRVNDEITSFGGTAVKTADDVRKLLARRRVGDEVEVVVARGARTETLTVTLARRRP
ncbi:MAG TPA: S1C family serine protease [Urbifossiella sp.]|nr:S1C family serine protease [Urbifossiella sp.]